MKSYYDILQVNPNSSQAEIDTAYRILVNQYNPSLQPNDKIQWANAKIQELSEAYSVLSDPNLRAEYNLKLGFGSEILYNNLYNENEKLKEEIENLKSDSISKKKKKKKKQFRAIY